MNATAILETVLARGGRVVGDGPRPRLLVPVDLKPLVEANREALRAEVQRFLAKTEGKTAQPDDALARLLDVPLRDLTRPLAVASRTLGETVFLVANETQARAVEARGDVAYSPPEVAILRELAAAVPADVWAERLRLIHQAKRELRGILKR